MTQPPPPQPPSSSNPNFYPIYPWMWNPSSTSSIPRQPEKDEDEDSWEVRAFAEDTGSVTGTTWPPRSYTCTFCRREFRSAQALGGHMNVHRRDRVRLQQQLHQQLAAPNVGQVLISPHTCGYISNPNSAIEFFRNDTGFCVCQQLANPCNCVLVGSEIPVHGVVSYLDKEAEYENEKSGEGDEVNEVELDLELRLGS